MRIQRLYIGDFGIIRNQIFEDLAPGIVVIGGLNRAGKTTLLNVLRYLGYGFPRDSSLPLAVDKYEVESDLILDSGEKVNIYIHGYGEPGVKLIDGNSDNAKSINNTSLIGDTDNNKNISLNKSCKEIYNNIDLFTYSRLFTISLDELQKIDSSKDGEKVQSVLLGAGFSEIVQIPTIEKDLLKEADNTGGKRGSPKVKSFKGYYQAIIEGMKEREEAMEQVGLYKTVQQELHEVNNDINRTKDELKEARSRLLRLDVLKSNYKDYEKLREIEIILNDSKNQQLLKEYENIPIVNIQYMSKKYYTAFNDCQELVSVFSREVRGGNDLRKDSSKYWEGSSEEVSNERVKRAKELLVEYSHEISSNYHKLAGLKGKINHYFANKKEHREEMENILIEMDRVNEGWNGDMDSVLDIKCDDLKMSEVYEDVENYQSISEELKVLRKELETKEKKLYGLDTQEKAIKSESPSIVLNRYLKLFLFFVVLGGSLSFFFFWHGIMIMVGGIIGSALYGFICYILNNSAQERVQLLIGEKDIIRLEIKDTKTSIEKLESKFSTSKQKIDSYYKILKIKKPTSPPPSPAFIKEYFRSVQALKWRIKWFQALQKRISEMEEDIVKELENICHLLKTFSCFLYGAGVKQSDPDQRLWGKILWEDKLREGHFWEDFSEDIIDGLEKANKYLELAKELTTAEHTRDSLENNIKESLTLNNDVRDIKIIVEEFASKCEQYGYLKSKLIEDQSLRGQVLQVLKTESTRKAFNDIAEGFIENDNDLMEVFDNIYSKYPSFDRVEEAYINCMGHVEDFEKRLDELKSKSEELKITCEQLATTEKLDKATDKINNARAGLLPLAEKHAVLKGAAFILGSVRRKFLEDGENMLLKNASNIMEQITSGEYKRILPGEDILEADFQAVAKHGLKQKSTDALSRGTREQLFLAVRIGKIMEITPPLPVIIDDSLANFDSIHLEKTVDVLIQLSKTHQVFILTCHPWIVSSLRNKERNRELNGQFWKLVDGKVHCCSAENLEEHLKYGSNMSTFNRNPG